MRLLVLGGTDFVGRHITQTALERGMRVTLFHRGRTGAGLFPGVERVRGDRGGNLAALDDRSWDAVVDTSGYFPDQVRRSARRLAGRIGHYAFVSSISVYADPTRPGNDESSPVHAADETSVELSGASYGPLKVACEQAVAEELGDRAMIARAGLIAGPYDNVPRLAYWLRRAQRGGVMLAPGGPERPVQLVDARDLARFVLDGAERRTSGTFNVTGEAGTLALGALLDACRQATGGDVRPAWASDSILQEEKVPPFDGLPYWVPEPALAIMRVSTARAVAAGLETRPIGETVRDTWAWLRTLPPETPPLRREIAGVEMVCGPSPDDEKRILRRLDS